MPASDLATWQAGHIVVNASAADAWNNPVSVDRPIGARSEQCRDLHRRDYL
ncbi:hypothetical protein QNH14_18420 [Apirhabdus apintestini]|nr:hypothetical protein QNH14_18420 [Enterobacteriaceae bacterium CA-0114]